VTAPSGEHIYYAHRKSACGAELDCDMNVTGPEGDKRCNSDAPIENIFWANDPPIGTYRVVVKMYKRHTGQPYKSKFTVRIKNVGPDDVAPGEMCQEFIDFVDPSKETLVTLYEPGLEFKEHAKKTSPQWRYDGGEQMTITERQMQTFSRIEARVRAHYKIPEAQAPVNRAADQSDQKD